MSISRHSSIGSTLAGGIQDVAALLPIIGTEQCETHVGSALKGGYLYGAATPLSIFGSLGIVKAGVSILFSSVSISTLKLSIFFRNFKPTIKISKQRQWLGARMLNNAGFKLTGSVAPLIGMDEQRFKAETRLLEILEEKHIDNPDRLSVDWKSRQWNIVLILSTFLCAALSLTPYIALLLGPQSWRPVGIHFPWVYPSLRIFGSCIATVCCQFIIQSRVISLMKSRILFMTIDHQLQSNKPCLDAWAQDFDLEWDEKLPAEQCLHSLRRVLDQVAQVENSTDHDAAQKDPATPHVGNDHEAKISSPHLPTPKIDVVEPSASTSTSKPGSSALTNEPDDMIELRSITPEEIDRTSRFSSPNTKVSTFTIKGTGKYRSISRHKPSSSAMPNDDQEGIQKGPISPHTGSDRTSDFSSAELFTPITVEVIGNHFSISMPKLVSSVLPAPVPSSVVHRFRKRDLDVLERKSFPFSVRDTTLTVLVWIILGLSLPATVAGYIGCFTLISATPILGNGPFIWLGLEAALSILRIIMWASNPSFDEGTEVKLKLQLSEHQPLVTTIDYHPNVMERPKLFPVIPEREFLQQITPFTGPLEQFRKEGNIVLFFTLKDQLQRERQLGQPNPRRFCVQQPSSLSLMMAAYDSQMETGVMFRMHGTTILCDDVVVKYNTISRQMEAIVKSGRIDFHRWNIQHGALLTSLMDYYRSIIDSFDRSRSNENVTVNTAPFIAVLPWKWDLSQRSGFPYSRRKDDQIQNLRLTAQDQLYTNRGYEHYLKTKLMERWTTWLIEDMASLQTDLLKDCVEGLEDATREPGRLELTRVEQQLAWSWPRQEELVVTLSVILENILQEKMQSCADMICRARKDPDPRKWMMSEFESGRRKRLHLEKDDAVKRMEKARDDAMKRAEIKGRPWSAADDESQWKQIIQHIDHEWQSAIEGGWLHSEVKVDSGWVEFFGPSWPGHSEQDADIYHDLRCIQVQLMNNTVQRIRKEPMENSRIAMDMAYAYPRRDPDATARFIQIPFSASKGMACSAIVYDAQNCNKEIVQRIVSKSTTRSVIKVNPEIAASIEPNDHLLFLSCEDGQGEEPAFVRQNRERWWGEQTSNSSMFYFTPEGINSYTCYANKGTIAVIFLFLVDPSVVRINLHHQGCEATVTFRENGEEVGKIAGINSVAMHLQLDGSELLWLQPGKHKLEVVHKAGIYYLEDIDIQIAPNASKSNFEDSWSDREWHYSYYMKSRGL